MEKCGEFGFAYLLGSEGPRLRFGDGIIMKKP